MRNYINIMESNSISDSWFADGFKTYKKSSPVSYRVADRPGTIETLEGPVSYDTGFYIMTGPKGEQYPITPQRFKDLYNDEHNGTALPKKIIKVAKLADHDGAVKTSWGETLHYTAGNDVIVRHGPGDFGVVKKDIFAQTYNKGE